MEKHDFSLLGDRLKQLRGGQSQSDFSGMIGVPFRTYQRYESGERIPKGDVLDRIAQATGRSVDWLLTGGPTRDIDRVTEFQVPYGLDPITKKIVSLLRNMDEPSRRDILKSVKEKSQAAAWRREKKIQQAKGEEEAGK